MCAASAHEVADLIATRDTPVVLLSAGLSENEAQEALAQALGARGEAPPIVIIGAGEDQRTQVQTLLAKGATGAVPRPYDRERLAAQLLLYAVGSMPAVVLVVDDSKVEREHSVSVLHEAGHRAFAAEDGRAALGILDEHPEIDLVLSDVMMPNLDGFGLCRAIRSRPGGRNLPVLLLTALGDIVTQSRAIEAGGDDVLTKPISATELAVRVRSLLRLKTLQRKLALRNAELEKALRLRDDLTHLLVHDFRNPLARILVGADLVAAQCKEKQLHDLDEMVEKIIAACLRLQGLTNDLLDVARLEDGQVQPALTEFKIGELAGELAEDVRALGERQSVAISVEVGSDLRVRADREWIYRVLQNLVDNAIKHSPRKGVVTIGAAAQGEHIEITVTDQGDGIPEAHRGRIFEKFAQLRGESRRGVGLGLAFCKLAIEAHGGHIQARNHADSQSGAVFAFTLPVA